MLSTTSRAHFDRSPRTRRVRALAAFLTTFALVALGLVVPAVAPDSAQAAGTPDVQLTRTVAASTLYGDDAAVTLTATQSSGVAGYNLSFTDTLPAGAAITSSTFPFRTILQADNTTVVIFSNVADLVSGATVSLDYTFSYPTGAAPFANQIGDSLSGTAGAFVNSNPRVLPKFDPITGAAVAASFTGSAAATSSTKLVPYLVEKTEPNPESELLRGVQDHKTIYTVKITNNKVVTTNNFQVVDYLPAGLEFLGCTNVDNSALGTEEYLGSGRIDATPGAALVNPCVTPASVETVTIDPDGAGALPNAVYTKVTWTGLGNLAANATLTFDYAAAIPLRENVAFAGVATANLDNNTGALTVDEQALTNLVVVNGTINATTYEVTDTRTVTAEDVAIQKSVDTAVITQTGVSVWTFAVQTSEYALSTTPITIVDTIPNGLEYIGSSIGTPVSIGPGANGTQVVTWWLTAAVGPNEVRTYTMTTETLTDYRAGGPVSAGDSWTNTIALDTIATVITDNPAAQPAVTTALPIVDASAAGQSAAGVAIAKDVATPAAIATDCATTGGLDFSIDNTGPFHPGDLVCYRLTVEFPALLNTLDTTVNDFLPAGFGYVSSAFTSASDIQAAQASFEGTVGEQTFGWTIPIAQPLDVFQVIVTARILDADAVTDGGITANLMKVTFNNTGDEVFQLRDQASAVVEKPIVGLQKRITAINGVGITPVSQRTVEAGDAVTYSVTVSNTGGQAALDVSVRDLLPTLVDCSDVASISGGGVCSGTPGQINWTIPTLAGGASQVLTYVVTAPADSSAGEKLVNTAGVRQFEGGTNSVPTGSIVYVPRNNIDPSLTPNTDPAKESAEIDLATPGVVKSATTALTEAGNSTSQATIGELITYTVSATIPQGSTLYGPAALTDIVDGRLEIVGTPTYTIAGAAGTNLTVTGNTINAEIPTPYINASGSGDDIVTLTFQARVRDVAGTVRGNSIPNRATLSWDDSVGAAQSSQSNNAPITIVEPNISLEKSSNVPSGQVTAGQTVQYTLTYANTPGAGNISTAHDVVIVDTVPSTITPLANDGVTPLADGATLANGGLWTLAARTLTFTVPDSSQSIVLTYQARVNNPVVGSSTLTNTAEATATSLPGSSSNERTVGTGYTSTDAVTLEAPAITTTKSVTPTSATIGETAQYTVTATIPAGVVAYDVTLVDTLPTNAKFVTLDSFACVQGGSPCLPAVSSELLDPTVTAPQVGLFLGDLGTAAAAARVVTFTYTVVVLPGAQSGNTLTNSVRPNFNATDTVTGTPTSIPSTFDRTGPPSTADVTVVEPRITIDKDVSDQAGDSDARRAKPGTPLTYTLVVTNTGTSPAWDVDVTDTPDARITGYTSTPPAGVIATDTNPVGGLAWTIAGPIAPGATVTITYTATMPVIAAPLALDSDRTVVNTADIPHYFGVDPALQIGTITYKDYDDVTADVVTVTLDVASIGDRVWFDANKDGTQDASEPGLANVGVTVLYAGADGIFGNGDDDTVTIVTDAAGNYLATQLPGGLYRITVDAATLPAGVTASYDLDGTTVTPNGFWQGTLGANTAPRNVDFGYTGTGSIGDRVWFDQNLDGVQDAGEPGLPGATVTVTWHGVDGDPATIADNVTYVTTTGANGAYLVENLPAGGYTVVVTGLPVGYAVVADPAGIVAPSNSSTVTLGAGANNLVQDFGFAGTGSIGDFVWLDRDNDGVQDALEPGIFGATVALTWFGADGVVGGGDDATFTTTTSTDGRYLFPNLVPGAYSVAVTGGLPQGATNSYDRDGNTNSVAPVSLGAGQNDDTLDFGYNVTSIIGDRVWWDRNRDGVQDAGEPGLAGVGIRVTYLGADGVLGGGDDLVFTTTTNATGDWSVVEIPDGNFIVEVTGGVPAGFTPTFDSDGIATPGRSAITVTASNLLQDFGYAGNSSIGDTVWLDLDADGTQDAGEPGIPGATVTLVWAGPDGTAGGGDDVTFTTTTSATGTYSFPGLPAGSYTVTVDTTPFTPGLQQSYDLNGPLDSTASVALADSTDRTDVDFGYAATGVIGDTVWLDQDSDGVRDAGEPGIPAVTVTLVWGGLDGVIGGANAADDVAFTTVTDTTGAYLFENLPAGSYSVTVAGLPTGLTSTADPDGAGDSTAVLTLANGASNLAQDFGYVGNTGIGDLLWLDFNSDGTQGATEPGLSGIPVTVRHPGFDGVLDTADDIITTVVTDAAGRYLVEGLPAGLVRVSYVPADLPAGLIGRSDLDGDAPFSTLAQLLEGTRLDADFVVVGTSTLDGIVFDDVNGNGVRDPGDRGLAGIDVLVTWTGLAGPVSLTVTTNADGSWSLADLPAGEYTTAVDLATAPKGYRPSTGTTSAVSLPPFAGRSVIQGLTNVALAFTGFEIGITLYLAASLLALGLLGMLFARWRRRA